MENFSYHVPFYVVTGGVKTSGHSSDLNAGAVGLYDRATFSVATAVGNGKEFFFAGEKTRTEVGGGFEPPQGRGNLRARNDETALCGAGVISRWRPPWGDNNCAVGFWWAV